MTGSQTLLARAAVGVVGAAASLILASIPQLRTLPDAFFKRLATAALIVSRLGLFSFIFLVLHLQLRGDVGYYWTEALAAMQGKLPYRDFDSSYAPLHPYLDLVAIHLWHRELSLLLLAIVAECAMFPLWLSIGSKLFPRQDLRAASFFYLASPLSLIFVTVDGQNNVIIALLLAAAIALLMRSSAALSGIAVGLTFSAVKILGLLFAPLFFLATPRRWRWSAGTLAVSGIVYGTCLALHLPIMQPLSHEAAMRTAGNLPYVIEAIAGTELPARLWDSLVLAGLFALILFVARSVRGQSEATRLRILTYAMPAVVLTLILLSKKGWPNYLMLVLFPLCLLVRRMSLTGRVLFALFGILAVVEHSYWASLLNQVGSVPFHALLLDRHLPPYVTRVVRGLAVLEALLISGYCWLLTHALREIADASTVVVAGEDRLLDTAPDRPRRAAA